MENYFNKIIELFVKSDVSTSSQNEFYRWLTGERFSGEKEKALRGLWNHMEEGNPAEVLPETQRSLNDVHKKIRQRYRRVSTKLLRFWQISAACLLIAMLSTLYFTTRKTPVSSDLIEQYVPIAEMTRLTLPDGTEVHMNSTATLLYPAEFTGESRSVYLIGEANFKVAKNEKQPFIVKSPDFQVTAVGTEFNVRVYPGDPIFSATLLSGSVEVRFNNLETSLLLKPNEQFTYNKQTKEETVSQADIYDVTAWQRGELVFKSVTLEEIITALERKYPYSFVYSGNALKYDKYTFRFKGDTSFGEVMDIIAEVSGNIKYRIEKDKCYISPK
ncbi:FecR family protein [uncultured Proteiniphilum sp.]|uniref:FecR family protein n=1 Tax=uncultured Proteiniphilum sp. TaxID=497637 RepID=UPI00260A6430|nr:FecR family protein [uncultured Proteiniphilum sp.]